MKMATPANQVVHSWRATARTVFQAGLSLALVLPVAIAALHIPIAGAAAIVVAVCGGITKVMGLPVVEGFLQKYVPFLAAAPADAAVPAVPTLPAPGSAANTAPAAAADSAPQQ